MPSSLLEHAREYQLEDARKIVSWGGRGILAHKTGLGKTFIALLVWELLEKPKRVLVIGSNSSMSVWLREIPRWTESTVKHISGPEAVRVRLKWIEEAQFTLCNFDIARRDVEQIVKQSWDMLIVDEAHKTRNRKTATWKAIKKVRAVTKHCIMASATLASRGPQDLWGVLNILDPRKFSSYWRFVNTFCFVNAGPFGREIVGARNAPQLWNLLREGYYTSRTYEEVLPDLPPLTREVVEIPFQESLLWPIYRDLDKDLLAIVKQVDGENEEAIRLLVPNVLSKIIRLRQLTVCPLVLGVAMGSPGISYIREALEEDPHTVVFTPFAAAIPHLEIAFKQVEGVTGVWSLYGGLKPEEVSSRIAEFKANQGVMICSISFAQSFSLDTVHTAYFLGFSWDPNENVQAEGRLKRMDSQMSQGVVVKYLVNEGTIDEKVREVLNGKMFTVQSFLRDHLIGELQKCH